MRYLEIALLLLSGVALIWFYSLLPGGSFVLMLALSSIALVYFAFGFIIFSKARVRSIFKGGLNDTPARVIVTACLTGLALSTLSIGVLFKILLMPGAQAMLMVGVAESVVLILVNVLYQLRGKSSASLLSISRLAIFLSLALFLLLTPELAIVRWQYRNHPGYVIAYIDFKSDPANEEKWNSLHLEHERVFLSPEEFELYKKSFDNQTREFD
jgi:hypothetical protein